MRSLLFVPGDSEKKLAKGLASGADVLIVDLEDSISLERKAAARRIARDFLAARSIDASGGPKLFVRVNPLASGMILDDLAAIVGARPDGIVLPKSAGGADIVTLSNYLSALEARDGVGQGSIAILPIASETAAAMYTFASYAGSSARLAGITWGCEDLAADVGAGAGLEADARAAERSGFTGKMVIHPAQVAIINRAFTPDDDAVAWARKVVAAFAGDPAAGVIGLDGKMLDRPHLRAAERVLARAMPRTG